MKGKLKVKGKSKKPQLKMQNRAEKFKKRRLGPCLRHAGTGKGLKMAKKNKAKAKATKGLWTRAEVNLLKKLFPNNPTPKIATKFGRKTNAVENKARRMGLRKSKKYLKSIGRYKRMEDRRAFLLKSKKGFCDCPKADCLLFLTCPGPSCNTIVLQCGKTGIIFPNPKEPYPVDIEDFGTCPNCDYGPIDAYGNAKFEDILNLGFKKEDLVGLY